MTNELSTTNFEDSQYRKRKRVTNEIGIDSEKQKTWEISFSFENSSKENKKKINDGKTYAKYNKIDQKGKLRPARASPVLVFSRIKFTIADDLSKSFSCIALLSARNSSWERWTSFATALRFSTISSLKEMVYDEDTRIESKIANRE